MSCSDVTATRCNAPPFDAGCDTVLVVAACRRFARARSLVVVVLVSSGVVLGGCGSTRNTSRVANPYTFDASALAGAPMPKDAVPYGNVVVDGSTSTQSFRLTGPTPHGAITEYVATLQAAGWALADGPTATGATDWRAELTKEGADLVVTVAPSADAPATSPPDVDMSIEVTTS